MMDEEGIQFGIKCLWLDGKEIVSSSYAIRVFRWHNWSMSIFIHTQPTWGTNDHRLERYEKRMKKRKVIGELLQEEMLKKRRRNLNVRIRKLVSVLHRTIINVTKLEGYEDWFYSQFSKINHKDILKWKLKKRFVKRYFSRGFEGENCQDNL